MVGKWVILVALIGAAVHQLWPQKIPNYALIITSTKPHFRFAEGSTVFITDASLGIHRELALLLSELGVHVLAGVRSNAEMKSFSFDRHKGIETIIFDVNEPVTFSNVLYRVKQIQKELDRSLRAVVINNAGT